MSRILSIAFGLVFATNAMAYTHFPATCEKNDTKKKAAQKLLEQFLSGQNVAAVEVKSVNMINVGDEKCNQNWAFEVLDLAPQNPEILPTCGIEIAFSSPHDLEQFAKFAMMLNKKSESSVFVTVKGGFSSRDPHDPHGNESIVPMDVPFCAKLAE